MPVAVLFPSFAAASAATITDPSTLSFSVFDTTAPSTPLDLGSGVTTLTQWWGEQTTDTDNDCGHGQLNIQNDDAHLAFCTHDRILRKYVDSTAAFQWIIEGRERQSIHGGEEKEQFTVISGDGIGKLLAKATVQPTRGYDITPWASTRTFSFASPEYVPSGWSNAINIVSAQSNLSTYYSGLPTGWMNPAASLIGPSGCTADGGYIGHWYVIGDHTYSSPTGLVTFNAADNKADVYGDGFQLTTFGTEVGFNETHRATMYVAAGQFRIAAKISNYLDGGADPPLGRGDFISGNPTMFLHSSYPIDGRGRLGGLGIQTDTQWSILEYPTTPPGWTIGGVVIQLLTEAQARGLLSGVTWDFSATVDSRGIAWPVHESITLNVDDDYLTVMRSFAGVYCDWAFAPDSLNLSMWNPDGRGVTQAVTYAEGSNLKSLRHNSVKPGIDALVVSWPGGPQFRYPATGGTHEASYSTNARTRSEAEREAAFQLSALGGTRTEFIGEIEPRGTGDQPYTAYTVGDIVAVPDENGTATAQKVTQIVGTSDGEGNPVWVPSFADLFLTVEARLAQVSKRMANGTLGGYAATASSSGPAPQFGSTINSDEITFSAPDPLATGEATKNKVPSQSGNLFAVAATLKTAGSTATTFTYLVDGVDVLGGAGSIGAGVTFKLFTVNLGSSQFTAWIEGNKSVLTVNVTGVGTSAAGLVVEGRVL